VLTVAIQVLGEYLSAYSSILLEYLTFSVPIRRSALTGGGELAPRLPLEVKIFLY